MSFRQCPFTSACWQALEKLAFCCQTHGGKILFCFLSIHVRGTLLSKPQRFPAQQIMLVANVVSAARPWVKSRRAAAPSRRVSSTWPQRLWSDRVTSTTRPPAHSDTHPLCDNGVANSIMLHGRHAPQRTREGKAGRPGATLHPQSTPSGAGTSLPPQKRGRGPRPAPQRTMRHGVRSPDLGGCALDNLKPVNCPPLAPFCRQRVHRHHQISSSSRQPQLGLTRARGQGAAAAPVARPLPAPPGRVWCEVKTKTSAQVGRRGKRREGRAARERGQGRPARACGGDYE